MDFTIEILNKIARVNIELAEKQISFWQDILNDINKKEEEEKARVSEKGVDVNQVMNITGISPFTSDILGCNTGTVLVLSDKMKNNSTAEQS